MVVVLIIATAQGANPATGDKRLDRVTGTVGFQSAPTAPLHQVFGDEVIADDQYATTQAASAAELVLPDSSIVALGQSTLVQVGAFDSGVTGPGATIAVLNGTLRFDVKRPQGGAANYRFTTATSQIAVRGTIGLLSFLNGTTTVACLVCATDSVSIVTGGHTIALVNGQFVAVDASGAVTTGSVTTTFLATFQAQLVSTIAESGVPADTIVLGGAHEGSVAAIVAAGVLAGAAVAISHNTTPAAPASPFTQPSATPTPGATPTPAPSGSPTATPTPGATATPTPGATATPTPGATATPTPGPTATPTASANVGIEAKRHTTGAPAAEPVPGPAVPDATRGHVR